MILVVGLSPAWQRTLVFEKFAHGKVNRAANVTETASGKGVNVARVASILGANVRLLTVAGGARGRLLRTELKRQGLNAHVVPVSAETRICQTLLVGGVTTELVEEAEPLSIAEGRRVARAFAATVRKAELVILTGTVPPGCGDDFYARLVTESHRRGVPVLIDAQNVQLIRAIKRRPFLVKINRDELAGATHVNCDKPLSMLRALRKLSRRGPQWAVISDGARDIYVSERSGARASILKPPHVKTRNSIGSGDAMLAGLAVGLLQGRSMIEAVQLGVACGAANAMTTEPGSVRPTDVRRLFSTRNKRVLIV